MNPLRLGLQVHTRYHFENWKPCGTCRACRGRDPWACVRKRLRWADDIDNLVVTAGLNRLLAATLKGSAIGGATIGYQDGRRLPTKWLVNTAYSVGDAVRGTASTQDRWFICEVAGTSHASVEPTWPTTAGASIADNTVTWREASVWFLLLKGTGTAVLADTMASHGAWSEITPYSNATRPALILGSVAAGSVDNTGSVAVFNINAGLTVFGAGVCDLANKGTATGTLYGAGDFASSRAVLSGDTLQATITCTVT